LLDDLWFNCAKLTTDRQSWKVPTRLRLDGLQAAPGGGVALPRDHGR
jgi:hypothetical protein